MIIKINQTQSPIAEFDILIDDTLCYTGSQTFQSVCLENILFDLNGNPVLKSRFMPFEELKNALPFKWAWSEKQTENHVVLDSMGNPVGAFFEAADSFSEQFSERYVAEYGGYELFLYPIERGTSHNTLIFFGDMQIGQLNKNNTVEDNKDWYRLYLLDEYKELAQVLSLFALYFDSCHYLHRGEYSKSVITTRSQYTYTKYSKLYDPNWLPAHFTVEDESETVAKMLRKRRKNLMMVLWLFVDIAVFCGIFIVWLWFHL